MKPGIYPNIPNAEYHGKIDALSASDLKLLCKSPAHYREAKDNPLPPTPAMVFGSAFHSYLLEPEKFDTEFAVAPQCDRRTKAGKEEFGAFQAATIGKTIITQDDMGTIEAMRESALKSDTIKGIFLNMAVEQTAIWEDPTYGFLCKARPDIKCDIIRFLWDLKTCTDASPKGFARDCAQYGYHIQADWYLNGVNLACGRREYDYFGFIAIEKTPPYAVQTYVADDEFLRLGREKNDELRQTYYTCLQSGRWPGYPDKILPLSLPAWAA